ncbi:uncharacterized protein LOC133795892 [Humulus lupulus]|uniref:uncharacterized protein LOC133795892 n=1 Tax=Humulus lupulus TaxID=3486 RepID=UPI002B40A3B9|nr:uncharacterized protein LOC133795892 [Humulus lupulus]
MKTLFLERYFQASKVGSIRNEICGFLPLGRSMIDATSGGALLDKTPIAARSLISNMATKSQQFGVCHEVSDKGVNETNSKVYQVEGSSYLRYGNQQQIALTRPPGFNYQQRPQQAYATHPQQPHTRIPQDQEPSMSDMLKTLVASNIQTQVILQSTQASLKNLESTMGQIATSLSQSKPQNQGKLHSQPVRNPRESANAITLRSGKTYDPPTIPSTLNNVPLPPNQPSQQDKDETPTITPNPKPTIPTYVTTPLFPSRLRKTKKDEAEKEILKTFRKVEVSIPLLDAIKQVPHCTKFLKELCTNKRKLKRK